MEFIKNNKMFIFLFISYLIINLVLSIIWIRGDEDVFINWQNQNAYTESLIENFHGIFNDERKSVDLNWDIQLAKTSIDKFEIKHNEKVLREGINETSAVLSIEEYDIPTGNNKFDLVVSLKDNTVLEKTVYVYIDEVMDFDVVESVSGTTITYYVTYIYDDRNPVSPPTINVYNSDYPLSLNYKNAKRESKDKHYITMNAEYTLDYRNVDGGRYEINLIWEFVNYNLSFPKTSIIHVAGE